MPRIMKLPNRCLTALMSVMLLTSFPLARTASATDFSSSGSLHREIIGGEDLSTYSGITAAGNRFSFAIDGSGDVMPPGTEILDGDGWDIECKNDAMSDARSCTASHKIGHLLIVFGGKLGVVTQFCLYDNDFPGRAAAIRVAETNPRLLRAKGCASGTEAREIVASLHKDARLRTRSYSWPYDVARDEDFILTSTYSDALELIQFLLANGAKRINWK